MHGTALRADAKRSQGETQILLRENCAAPLAERAYIFGRAADRAHPANKEDACRASLFVI